MVVVRMSAWPASSRMTRGVGAGVGEVGAEGVAQDVRAATVLRQARISRVAGDDPRDVAGAQSPWRLAGAWQREQQVLGRRDGAELQQALEQPDRRGVGLGRVTAWAILTQAVIAERVSSSSGIARVRPRLP